MLCQAGFDQWLTTLHTPLPHVRQPQATGLALWSCGMGLARSCALRAVRSLLAAGMHRKAQRVRQPLRAWDADVPRKRGATRPALRVETGFPPLRGWVVRWWQGTPWALAIDATTLGHRGVGRASRGVSRGGAIPVAGGSLPAGATHAWRRAGLRRWRRRRPARPQGWTVRVWAARGGDAPWWLRRITRLGWPPLVRRNTGGSWRATGAPCWRPGTRLVPPPGTRGRGTGLACPRHQGACPLLARGAEGDKAPGRLLRDLAPEASAAGGDGLRAWSAQGLQLPQRAGWPWHRTRRSAPDRAARLGLAVAVATWWRRSVGGEADATMPASTLRDVPGVCPERPRTRRATRLRLVSVWRQGWVRRLRALLRQEPWPEGHVGPDPWPAVPPLEGATSEPPVVLPVAA